MCVFLLQDDTARRLTFCVKCAHEAGLDFPNPGRLFTSLHVERVASESVTTPSCFKTDHGYVAAAVMGCKEACWVRSLDGL